MIEFDGHVSLDDIVAIARAGDPVRVSKDAIERVRLTHEAADRLSRRTPTYGRSTGVGANRLTQISQSDDQQGMRLLRSHAVDAGAPISAERVRAMLGVRLAQLCMPGSGIRSDVIDGLQLMLNENALPVVLEFNSIGTGDLAALAGTALTLMGERPATKPFPAMPAWGVDSALPFMSSGALTIGRAALAAADLRMLLNASYSVYALSFVGLQGNRSPLSEVAAEASASSSAKDVTARLRALVGTSNDAARIQDPYALRAFAVAVAPLADALSRFVHLLERLINVAQENPLFTEDDVIHHAGFHQATLALDADTVALALAQTTPLTLSRIRMMIEPDYTGRPPFLSDGTAGASGVMMVEYVAAAAHGEIQQMAHPASLTTAVLSRGTEEDASFAPVAVAQLEKATDAFRVLAASELLIAVRLLRQCDVRPENLPTDNLRRVFYIASELPLDDADRELRTDLAHAQELLFALAKEGH